MVFIAIVAVNDVFIIDIVFIFESLTLKFYSLSLMIFPHFRKSPAQPYFVFSMHLNQFNNFVQVAWEISKTIGKSMRFSLDTSLRKIELCLGQCAGCKQVAQAPIWWTWIEGPFFEYMDKSSFEIVLCDGILAMHWINIQKRFIAGIDKWWWKSKLYFMFSQPYDAKCFQFLFIVISEIWWTIQSVYCHFCNSWPTL